MENGLSAMFETVATECNKQMDDHLDVFWKKIETLALQEQNNELEEKNAALTADAKKLRERLNEYKNKEMIEWYINHFWWIGIILLVCGLPVCILVTKTLWGCGNRRSNSRVFGNSPARINIMMPQKLRESVSFSTPKVAKRYTATDV